MSYTKKTWTEGTQTSPAKVTIDGTDYNVTPETRTGATPATAADMNNIENGIYNSQNVELLNVTNTAPTTCSIGDKYFNTTSKKIFTATASNTWGSTGEDAIDGILYINKNNNTLHYYNGTTLIGAGGGSVTPKNTYTNNTTDIYSCDYVNKLIAVVTASCTIPTGAAGTKGYLNISFTIPAGYKCIGVDFENGSILDNTGLQITPIYGFIGATGSVTDAYIQYYSPNGISTAAQGTITLKLSCARFN